jgi:hypothetical protein
MLMLHLVSKLRKVLLESFFEIKRIGLSAETSKTVNEQPEPKDEKWSSWVRVSKIEEL